MLNQKKYKRNQLKYSLWNYYEVLSDLLSGTYEMKLHDLKGKYLKMHNSAAGTLLNLRKNLEKLCTKIPHHHLRADTPV